MNTEYKRDVRREAIQFCDGKEPRKILRMVFQAIGQNKLICSQRGDNWQETTEAICQALAKIEAGEAEYIHDAIDLIETYEGVLT